MLRGGGEGDFQVNLSNNNQLVVFACSYNMLLGCVECVRVLAHSWPYREHLCLIG